MNLNRRNFMTRLGAGGLATLGLQVGEIPAQTGCQRVSGCGSYILGPYEPLNNADQPVYLTADMGFDETLIFCKVATNFVSFRFPTARMGIIDFAAHEFFMDMESVSIDDLSIKESNIGLVANFIGIMRSETRVFTGERMQTFIEEDISFGCDATHLIPGARIAVSEINFSMTARFDPLKEHAAIFGEQVTFAGHVNRGSIIISA